MKGPAKVMKSALKRGAMKALKKDKKETLKKDALNANNLKKLGQLS